jgi:hypothetical protein
MTTGPGRLLTTIRPEHASLNGTGFQHRPGLVVCSGGSACRWHRCGIPPSSDVLSAGNSGNGEGRRAKLLKWVAQSPREGRHQVCRRCNTERYTRTPEWAAAPPMMQIGRTQADCPTALASARYDPMEAALPEPMAYVPRGGLLAESAQPRTGRVALAGGTWSRATRTTPPAFGRRLLGSSTTAPAPCTSANASPPIDQRPGQLRDRARCGPEHAYLTPSHGGACMMVVLLTSVRL